MEIGQGDDASIAFLNITFEDVPEEEVTKTREALIAYCKMDTEGMVRIAERLKGLVT